MRTPGYGSDQNPLPGPGNDFYCDANFVNDNWCPEYDTFEGNKYTMLSNLHTCDAVPPNDYSGCDRNGCGTNAYYADSTIMCPEERCTINTNRLFRITHTQVRATITTR